MDLRDITAHRSRAAVLVDYDGTLSEIAPTPQEARPVPGAVEALEALTGRYAVVGVVSGRRAAEVAAAVGNRIRCFGLYGLEDTEAPHPATPLSDEILAEVRAAAHAVPGTRVEPKGPHVAVHYRGTADPEAAGRILRGELGRMAGPRGLRVLEGKQVVELGPSDGPTKGAVVLRVVREGGLRAVLYAGDDLADLEAFSAVEDLVEEGLAGLTVGVRTEETPEEIVERARLVVDGPQGLVDLLRALR